MIHDLKCWPEYFQAVKSGIKPFEYRKDDRGYKVGDVLHLREYDPATFQYSGDEIDKTVTYGLPVVTYGAGNDERYVIMGLSPRPDWTPCAEGQNLPTKDGIYLVTYKLAEYGVALLSFSTATYGGGWNIPFPEHHFISEKDIIAWSEKPDPYNPDQFREPTKKMPDCLTCNTRDKCTDKLGGHVFCFEADGDG